MEAMQKAGFERGQEFMRTDGLWFVLKSPRKYNCRERMAQNACYMCSMKFRSQLFEILASKAGPNVKLLSKLSDMTMRMLIFSSRRSKCYLEKDTKDACRGSHIGNKVLC